MGSAGTAEADFDLLGIADRDDICAALVIPLADPRDAVDGKIGANLDSASVVGAGAGDGAVW